jgi:diguanylate cyclase (GGDEF)-like protein/PAS domain S-box-containing protein
MTALLDQNLYRLVLESLPVGVCVVNRQGKICVWSAGAERLTGHLRQEILGRSCQEDFLAHVDTEVDSSLPTAAPLLETLRSGQPLAASASLRAKGGNFVHVAVQTSPLRDEQNVLQGAVEIFTEAASPEKPDRRQSKLAVAGCLDPLTGVLNHAMIQGHLRESLSLMHVYPIPFCILCFAIDDLPKLRERYGQAAVDAIELVVAQTVEKALGPTDLLGRLLDHEFMAILTECSGGEVTKVGERLARIVQHAPIAGWGDTLHATVSIGATPALDSDTVGSIISRAEQALRASTEWGGNRIAVVEG